MMWTWARCIKPAQLLYSCIIYRLMVSEQNTRGDKIQIRVESSTWKHSNKAPSEGKAVTLIKSLSCIHPYIRADLSCHLSQLHNCKVIIKTCANQFSQHKPRHLFAVNTCERIVSGAQAACNCCFPWWLTLAFLAPCLVSKRCCKLFAFGSATTSLQRRHNGLSPLGTNTNVPFWI